MVDIGSIRPSQLITSFGPGSLVNLEHDTVMILGLQFWKRDTNEEKFFKRVSHPYLSRQLEKNYFKMPISGDKSAIPCISFPQWAVCQECHRLQKHPKTTNSKNGFFCRYCKSDLPLFHSTFVQICDNGHIQEFPWERWAHLNEKIGATGRKQCTKGDDEEPKLEFITTQKGTSLSNYKVRCLHCDESRTMTGATDRKKFRQLGFKECYKNQPWLNIDDKKSCDEDIYGVQVNSSSVYYPSTVTSLLIPNWIHDVDEVLDENYGANYNTIRADRKYGKSFDQIMDYHKDGMFKKVLETYSKEVVIKRLELRYESANLEISTEGEALDQEFDDFSDVDIRTIKGPTHDRKVDIEPMVIDSSSSLNDYGIGSLKKFHRLVSIQVLRGFTRGTPPDPYATETQMRKKHPFRKISSGSQKNYETGELEEIDWLPAVETRGEGLFFKFDETRLQNWEKRPKVIERFNVIVDSYAENIDAQERSEKQNVLERFSSPRYLLLHTFAHLLIREIADYAGYHEASLKERIYSTSDKTMRNGIMIYTSSSSSEGSLGGLVRLGDVKKFEEIIENTVKRSNSCSRDPLCGETNPVIAQNNKITSSTQLSGSSCYSCTLLPETSCQNFNNLLDRWMLEDTEDGFFRSQLNQ